MKKKAEGIKVGPPEEVTTIVGPLIHEEKCAFIDELIADAVGKGAKVLTGGTHEGPYYAPTVVADVTTDMRIFYEECFGPIIHITKANDAEDALRLCNDNAYGLSSALLTNDISTALTLAPQMESGMVHVNDSTVMGSRRAPFGGVKQSGMGREDSAFSVDEFTEKKWITIQYGDRGYPC
jgi:aldehyde dehydrogenase (NAD+)